MEEGEGSSGMEDVSTITTIDTAADSLDSSVIFHLLIDILGFILFMHQQIPSVLQDITQEFHDLHTQYNELEDELAKSEGIMASTRRKLLASKREVRMGIKRFEKLMACVSNVKTAIQSMIAEVPNVEKIWLVLGPSTMRPLHVYELNFVHGRVVSGDFGRSKVAEGLCRKAIRMLISRGAGAGANSYSGPTKLFVLVRAPASLNLPLHFLVKREIRQNKKMVPYRLRFRCRTQNSGIEAQPNNCAGSVGSLDSTTEDLLWFQCRHIIKGLPGCGTSPPED